MTALSCVYSAALCGAASCKARGSISVVAQRQTHSGALTPGSAPAYRWTVGWLLHTGCSSLLCTPYCIRSLKHWVPGSCDRSSTPLRTPDLRTCNLWRKEKGKKRISVVSKGRRGGSSDCSESSLCVSSRYRLSFTATKTNK